METVVRVLKPGLTVAFKQKYLNMLGIINSVQVLNGGSVRYEVAHVVNGAFVHSWVNEEMLDIIPDKTNQIEIGFKQR